MGEPTTFFKLDRELLDHWIWTKDPAPFGWSKAWIWLISKAAVADHESGHGAGITIIKRGQIPTSDEQLTKEWGWSRGKVRRFLAKLQKAGMIEIKRTSAGTILTITNYSKYQDKIPKKRTVNGTTDSTGKAVGAQGLEPSGGTASGTTVGTSLGTTVGTTVGTLQRMVKNGEECVCISAPRKNTHACGAFENVWLTDAEEAEIRETYERPQELIDKVSAWLTEHERKNHMATVNTFARNDKWPKRPVISHADTEEAQEEYVPMPDEIRKKWKGAIKKI